MRVLAHPDPCVLERELIARIDGAHPRGEVGRSLVVVPTRRLAAHVQRRLARAGPRRAWLGVEVLTFPAACRAVLDEVQVDVPRSVSRRLREALVARVAARRPGNLWSRYAARRPGALRRLAGAFDDLREAGVDPQELHGCAEQPRDTALAELYAAYVRRLEAWGAKGWLDAAGLVRIALPHATSFARRRRTIVLHGAYELIGVHLELLRALDRGRAVVALLPVAAGSRVTAYAERFARRHVLGPGDARLETLDSPADAGCGIDLAALYDEARRPTPPAPGRLVFRHTQGPVAEVRIAVRHALRAIADGCPTDQVAIVARTLEPYAAALETVFDGEELPWSSPLDVPLGRAPEVRDFLRLLAVVAGDFPRRLTVELLRSPRIRWSELHAGAVPDARLAERWSRQARILGGLEEWARELPAWAASPRGRRADADEDAAQAASRRQWRGAAAERIGAVLRRLEARVDPRPRTWSAHGRALRQLLEALFAPPPAAVESTARAVREELLAVLDDMERLESLVGEVDPVPFGAMLAWLEAAVQSTQLAPRDVEGGGIQVLDALQARGLTFEHVALLGLNAGVLPRRLGEDSVLGDALRSRLRERRGRPLPVRTETASEERLLLALVLGAARRRSEISWQRADDAGRARSLSLALRELARVGLGRPDLARLRRESLAVPSHPTQWLQHLADGPRLLAPAETMLFGALDGWGDAAFEALGEEFPELAAGLRMLRATQSFREIDTSYDARVAWRGLGAEGLSVSALETLGRCPLQFFFQVVLGVREPERELDALSLEARELGSLVHELLERLYRTLEEEGLFRDPIAETLQRRATALLEAERGQWLGVLGARIARRFPLLWEQTRETWLEALEAFVHDDLDRIAARGAVPVAFEETCRAEADLGGGVRLRLRGRFDRRLAVDGRAWIGDYKTGSVARRINPTEMLRARTLQAPLYQQIAGGDAVVELLGVGPSNVGRESRAVFDGFSSDDQRRGFRHTLRVLVELAQRGSFPLHDDQHCSWCAYALACRRKHPPTVEREAQRSDARSYRMLQRKTARQPLPRAEGTSGDG